VVTFSRHPFASTAYHPFGGLRGRGFAKGVLLSRLRDIPLTVANAHLSANRDGDWTPANRYHPMHRAQLDAVNRVCSGVECIVVTGDFNVASDSDLYDEYIAGAGWHDAFAGDPRPTFHTAFLPPGAVGRRIDYVLTRNVAVASTRLLFTEPEPVYLSDHAGLYAEVTVG
jgi:endonuclease/exonuclease/phosphatase family metal-dependent hydrolase